MSSSRHDERGIVGVILTIAIVFALVAVVELTRTLSAAQQINTRVQDITASVKGANTHLNTGCEPQNCPSNALPVLATTEKIVDQIDVAAKPLTGQAGDILTTVNSIDSTGKSILATATSINGTVHSIGGSVGTIGASVRTIQGSINGINSDVVAIKGSGNLGLGVVGINQRADIVIGQVNAIKADTGTINAQAGGILVQARAICNDRIQLLGLITVTKIC